MNAKLFGGKEISVLRGGERVGKGEGGGVGRGERRGEDREKVEE